MPIEISDFSHRKPESPGEKEATMKSIEIQSRDLQILHFLWKWKLVSSSALFEKFFPGTSSVTPYLRFKKLKKGGYIRFQSRGDGSKGAWALDKHGFDYLKKVGILPHLQDDGFKAEHFFHDFLVSAVHLGDWLHELPTGVEVFTEQEVRRFAVEDFPSWIPQTKSHRADGYWQISLGDRKFTIALEVERNAKRKTDYERAADFFNEEEKVFRVLWLAPRSRFTKIQSLVCEYDTERRAIHNFATIEDFEKVGWNAPIRFGTSKGKTIHYLLTAGLQEVSKNLWTPHLLDMRKSGGTWPSYRAAADRLP